MSIYLRRAPGTGRALLRSPRAAVVFFAGYILAVTW
jgi:hypothetical protein